VPHCATMSASPLPLSFITSADRLDQLPSSDVEVAIVGRSNVGKSSLLNALAGKDGLARTSKTPGRTQLLNVFRVPSGGTLVDLPGFGYAKVSATQRDAWQRRMEGYLTGREPLVQTLLLVDGEVGPAKLDVAMLGWLRAAEVPFTIVATKHDKVRSSKRERRKRDLAEGCGVAKGDIVWVSATTGVGVPRLRTLVARWLAGEDPLADTADGA
jgi:GTP-binding protein